MPEVKSFFCEKDPGEFLYSPASDYLSDPIFDPGGVEAADDATGSSDAADSSGEKASAAQKAG